MVSSVSAAAPTVVEQETPTGLVPGEPRPATRTLRHGDGTIERQPMIAYRAPAGQSPDQILARVYPHVSDRAALRELPGVASALAAAQNGDVAFFPRDPPTGPGLAPRQQVVARPGAMPPPPGSVTRPRVDLTARATSVEGDLAALLVQARAAGVSAHVLERIQETLAELRQTLADNLRPSQHLIEDRKKADKRYSERQQELARVVRQAEATVRDTRAAIG